MKLDSLIKSYIQGKIPKDERFRKLNNKADVTVIQKKKIIMSKCSDSMNTWIKFWRFRKKNLSFKV